MTLAEAAAQADELAAAGDERGLAVLRQQWDEEVEHAARHADYRCAPRRIARSPSSASARSSSCCGAGLEDESPAARGSALIALEGLSRTHPGDVNAVRSLLHELATNDGNMAVRRLAIVCLKNGSPQRETILLLNGLADDDEQENDVRKTAKTVATALQKRANTR